MASKTIFLSNEAYERLKALKTDGKSFSDVVLELTESENTKFESIVGEGIDTSFEELKQTRRRDRSHDEREDTVRRH